MKRGHKPCRVCGKVVKPARYGLCSTCAAADQATWEPCRVCERVTYLPAFSRCMACYRVVRKYGEDAAAYRHQGWDRRCDICGHPVPGEPAFDHDHVTNRFRGLVHGVGHPFNCNTFEGYYTAARAIGIEVACASLDRYLSGESKYEAWLMTREQPLRLWKVAS